MTTGYQNRNHVSIIERELIREHTESLEVEMIAPGLVRSNIETTGIELLDLLNCGVKIGDQAVVFFYKARVFCKQMDDVHDGLDRLMRNARQGVIAEIVRGGEIKIGDEITYCSEDI